MYKKDNHKPAFEVLVNYYLRLSSSIHYILLIKSYLEKNIMKGYNISFET
jgi:hypothetical protein